MIEFLTALSLFVLYMVLIQGAIWYSLAGIWAAAVWKMRRDVARREAT